MDTKQACEPSLEEEPKLYAIVVSGPNGEMDPDLAAAMKEVHQASLSNPEIVSPGGLPSTVTVEGMKAGARYARNQTLVNIMRDYRYVDARGMGVRNKIIPGMRAHNGTEPDLVEEEYRFTVRLWKSEKSRRSSSLA